MLQRNRIEEQDSIRTVAARMILSNAARISPRLERLLGWEPKIDLETGLQMSLEYFKKATFEEKVLQS